jgi:L,D-transpeptidase ErfK/SrfK
MLSKLKHTIVVIIILLVSLTLYCQQGEGLAGNTVLVTDSKSSTIVVNRNITIASYFQFLDSIVKQYDLLTSYKLTEHILVRANPWIIDTLENTDYYRMIARDSFVYDQKEMIVFKAGSTIVVPDSSKAKAIYNAFNKTQIDVNIPEYKLRIYENSLELYKFPVRVGRNEKKYLKMGDRITDLKTKTGNGHIVYHVRNPDYYNPANGRQYFVTKRDDDKVTKLPQIPFIETEVNGIRNGQLIHPTTNPVTLNKAYSNGCIGTNEADAWRIYYYAPIDTKLIIRYDLVATNEKGENVILKDIYGYYN